MMQANPPLVARCRVCGNTSLTPCVSLGPQYLSSIFPESLDYRSNIPKYPLDLVMCEKGGDESACGLVQLAHRIDLSSMYEAYPYTSRTNSSMPAILKDVAKSGRSLGHLRPDDIIMDIGGNDGTLLSFFQQNGFELLCIDPAKNIVPVSGTTNIAYIREFFNAKAYSAYTSKKARLVFSVAMFYHLDDPVGFACDLSSCLADDGVWIIQMAYLPSMLKTNMYDNIVHEHQGYYALQQMAWVMKKTDLEIFDVELNDVYGGSFRVFVKKKECSRFPQTERYRLTLGQEENIGLSELHTYRAFMERVGKARLNLRSLCRKIKDKGKTIWVYGASTKGNTILQYCGLSNNDIDAAADANPFKIGKFLIGSDIPIKDEESMRRAKPDCLLALPYSFVKKFMKRESGLIAKGTKFIIPLPEVHLVP